MMTLERFKETINFIRQLEQKTDRFVTALEELSPGEYCNCFLYSEVIDFIWKWLREDMHDEMDAIGQFLWENEETYAYDENGNEKLLFNDIDSLYNYIVNLNNQEN